MWKKTTTVLSITLISLALIAFVLIDNLSVKPVPNAYAQATGPAATAQPTHTSTPVPTDTDIPTPVSTATPVPTDTPLPANTDTPIPADTNTPVPAPNTDTPVPADTDTPVAADTDTPVPADTNTPIPADTDTPVPAPNTNTPVPANTDTPVPADTNTPIPADTDTPVPVETDTPVPVDTDTPVPADTDTPVPANTDTPVPTDTDTPVPIDTDTPVPTDTDTPIPADTDTPVPADTVTPIPTKTRVLPPQNPDIDLNVDPIIDPADVFDPEGPEPEEVTTDVDPETGESSDPRLAGISYQTKVRGENSPGDRNELEPILPGGIAIFVISFNNNSATPLYGVVIRMVVPPFTFFRLIGSGLFPLAQVTAADAPDASAPPIFEFVTENLHQNRGTEWELADGSGPCPEGAPAGTECIFRLGTVLPGESGELSVPTKVDEETPTGETFAIRTTLGAANLDIGLLVALNDPASVETVAQLPTSLPYETEPNDGVQLYLPFISH